MMAQKRQDAVKYLGELVTGIDSHYAHLPVSGLALDSRKVAEGDVFLAYPSHSVVGGVDGRNFIDKAVAAGAVVVLVESDEAWVTVSDSKGIPVIPVDQLSRRVSAIADNFYDHPSHHIPVMGVTGTNGKTSCTQLMMQLLNGLHKRCGVIGTLGAGVDGQLDKASNTTPDGISVQRYLSQWCDKQVDAVAMEISSHGLEQGRVAAIRFQLALFTNLSRDHLDYHGSMQVYAAAKSKLFIMPDLQTAVINIDDPFSSTLIDLLESDVELIRYSMQDSSAHFFVSDIDYHQKGVNATLHGLGETVDLTSPLLGAFNLSNLLGVIASLVSVGSDVREILKAVPRLATVPGRMERISASSDITVVVDYAHTPDALEQALIAMRLHCGGKLWCVFGCGGDRDHGKRQQMGAVAQRCSDHVVITSDNPRSESAHAIIDDILCGVDIPTEVQADRAAAIDFTIEHAKPGDCILIAGKGHEEYQHVGDQLLPFSDIKQARLALTRRGVD
ncbi:MAG: UDP-N-acetylmuramoyl-L-alanyl-D-glutamate--2,6-diaminopimelate ligase [Spongiibacteraceae bacterium]|nr:UDP-N-acetylmuramoyl-L-alanyl-D-glutamate--2,6-diaminopimelate ligase [Spongiibacteraceae bacterium]